MKKTNKPVGLFLALVFIASHSITAMAAAQPTSADVFAGYTLTILDNTTPATNTQTERDFSTTYFLAADGTVLGSMAYSDMRAIMSKYQVTVQLEGGGSMWVTPDGRTVWNGWFADLFNERHGLSTGSREAAVEKHRADLIAEYQRELVRLVNLEREKEGLQPYIFSEECTAYSQIRAAELPIQFSHTRPDGTDAGYEVIQMGAGTPEGAVYWWMNSPGHRAALLNENRKFAGAGVFITVNDTIYWQMYFERDPDVYANTRIFG